MKRKQTLPEDRGALHLCAIETVEVVEEMLQLHATTNQKRQSKQAKSRTGSDLVDLFIIIFPISDGEG